MPRGISSAMIAALEAQFLSPAFFVAATFKSGPVYLWTGVGTIFWNSQTWTGVGSLAQISTIEESSEVNAKGMTIGLSGIDATLLGDVLAEVQLGLPAQVYLALFDSGGNIIADPLLSFQGRMDQPTVTVGGETASISINCESRLLDMNTPVLRRYTDADQKLDYPNDEGFAYVSAIQNVRVFWGSLPGDNNFITEG